MNELTTIDNAAATTPTFNGDLYDRWSAYIDAKPATKAAYTRAIRQFARYLAARAITNPTRADVLDYRQQLADDGRKAATIQAYMTAVKLFFRWLNQEGIYENIAEHVKGAKLTREFKKDYLTSNQARQVLDSCTDDKRDYAIISLMVTTGLRTIEVSRANIEDLRVMGESTVLFVQGKGRDDKREYVKIEAPIEAAIRSYLATRSDTSEQAPLFTSAANRNSGGRLTTRSISRIVKNHLTDAGYNSDRLTAHSLRHTAATLMLLNGAKPEEVQQILRHKNINTTLIYSHALERAANTGEARAAAAIFG